MKMVKGGKKREKTNFAQKMSEVLVKKDFDKVLPIIKILEENGIVTPKEAESACGKSSATVRRYLGLLTAAGIVATEGSTNNTVYRVADNYSNTRWY